MNPFTATCPIEKPRLFFCLKKKKYYGGVTLLHAAIQDLLQLTCSAFSERWGLKGIYFKLQIREKTKFLV